jgi:hypothetical protein
MAISMEPSKPPIRVLLLVALVLAGLLAGGLYLQRRLTPKPMVYHPASKPAATAPAIEPAAPQPAPRTYMDVILKQDPDFPTTQPVPPVEISSAGHILLQDPTYLDPMGNLWITRPDAEATETVLKKAAKQQANITREDVNFVHWQRDEAGNWVPALVVPNARGNGFEILTQHARKTIGEGKAYDWARAVSLGKDRIAVPTDTGMSLFVVPLDLLNSKSVVPEYPSPPLAKTGDGHGPVQFAFFNDFPIIWFPPQGKYPGSSGGYRAIENAWFKLSPEEGWPVGIMQLIPLYDGVVQLIADGPDTVKLAMVSLNSKPEDEDKIIRLIVNLSDPDPKKRTQANDELLKFGPALWPIAERMLDASPPETRARLKDLLRNKISPLLGGMNIIGSKLKLVTRYPFGGALFYCERGVSIPRGEESPDVVVPAWLSIVPGDRVRLVPREIVRDLSPDKQILVPIDNGRWLVYDDVEGFRYLLEGVGPMPLLRPDEKKYDHYLGIDAQGRFLFRSSSSPTPTLVLDPTLPNSNSRLPVWRISYPEVGWDNENYPAMLDGAQRLRFKAAGWEAIEPEKGGKFFNKPEDLPAWPPLTLPTTQPGATRPSTQPDWPAAGEKPLLVDAERNYYFDGKESLRVIRKNGSRVVWPLPPTATGEHRPWLVQTSDHRLFLYNEPGRMLKIRPTPKSEEPFKLEATFTRRIPNTDQVLRMWVDPLGRICMAYDGKWIAIMFPKGYVPPETRDIIPGPELDEMLREE